MIKYWYRSSYNFLRNPAINQNLFIRGVGGCSIHWTIMYPPPPHTHTWHTHYTHTRNMQLDLRQWISCVLICHSLMLTCIFILKLITSQLHVLKLNQKKGLFWGFIPDYYLHVLHTSSCFFVPVSLRIDPRQSWCTNNTDVMVVTIESWTLVNWLTGWPLCPVTASTLSKYAIDTMTIVGTLQFSEFYHEVVSNTLLLPLQSRRLCPLLNPVRYEPWKCY